MSSERGEAKLGFVALAGRGLQHMTAEEIEEQLRQEASSAATEGVEPPSFEWSKSCSLQARCLNASARRCSR